MGGGRAGHLPLRWTKGSPLLSLQPSLQAARSGPCCPALCRPSMLLHSLVTSLTHAHTFKNISFLKFFSAPHWEYFVFLAGTLAQAPRSRSRKVYFIHNDKSRKCIEMNLTKKKKNAISKSIKKKKTQRLLMN